MVHLTQPARLEPLGEAHRLFTMVPEFNYLLYSLKILYVNINFKNFIFIIVDLNCRLINCRLISQSQVYIIVGFKYLHCKFIYFLRYEYLKYVLLGNM
jgi:hypothetical protein